MRDDVLTASAGINNLLDRGYYFRGVDTGTGAFFDPSRELPVLGVGFGLA